MKTSKEGLEAIVQREGLRLAAYLDTKGIPTIGVGHTGPEVKLGLVWTKDQVLDALAKDVATAEAIINKKVTVPINQNQFDALVSFTFNVGTGAFSGSTVLKRLEAGDYLGAALAMLQWEKPIVLVGRRESEYNQFIS